MNVHSSSSNVDGIALSLQCTEGNGEMVPLIIQSEKTTLTLDKVFWDLIKLMKCFVILTDIAFNGIFYLLIF